jgi:ring-1,2-phenylacetyl-CoA epoxidase subunit PaaE
MSVTLRRPQRRRPVFHELSVERVDRLTDDAVAVTFSVPSDLRETFAFQAGQHLTVRRCPPGEPEVRRSYSICSMPAELAEFGWLRVGIKLVNGGAFSTFAVGGLTAGDRVEVLPPLGRFTTAFAPDRERHYAAIVAGSGITPVLSLIATALSSEPGSRCTLLYGNRTATSVMFTEELADLKDRYPNRFQVVHVLSREQREAELMSGRLDGPRLGRLFDMLLPPSSVDEWFLCGPYAMVLDARAVLDQRGVPDHAVHTELFHVEEQPVTRRPAADHGNQGGVALTVRLDGRTTSVTMPRDGRVLDAALLSRPELPYACKGGVCGTCRARVTEGNVELVRNFALEPDELAAGYVLTCQATPLSERLTVDYDA